MSFGVDFFLHQMLPQCLSNSTGKLMKSAVAFAGAEDVGVVVHDFGFIVSETG